MTFRACIGPSANRVHIRYTGNSTDVPTFLTLCQRTSIARNVSGKVPRNDMCMSCLERMKDILVNSERRSLMRDGMTLMQSFAAEIGVEEII